MSTKLPWMCISPDCESPKQGATQFCATCSSEQRRADRFSNRQKEKKAIAKMSEKRKRDLKAYTALRKKHLERYPLCQVRLTGCTGKATEVHHSEKRGANYLKASSYMSTCGHCHMILETKLSAEKRRELGLLK